MGYFSWIQKIDDSFSIGNEERYLSLVQDWSIKGEYLILDYLGYREVFMIDEEGLNSFYKAIEWFVNNE